MLLRALVSREHKLLWIRFVVAALILALLLSLLPSTITNGFQSVWDLLRDFLNFCHSTSRLICSQHRRTCYLVIRFLSRDIVRIYGTLSSVWLKNITLWTKRQQTHSFTSCYAPWNYQVKHRHTHTRTTECFNRSHSTEWVWMNQWMKWFSHSPWNDTSIFRFPHFCSAIMAVSAVIAVLSLLLLSLTELWMFVFNFYRLRISYSIV